MFLLFKHNAKFLNNQSLEFHCLFHCFANAVGSWGHCILQIFGIWHWDINRCYSLRRTFQEVKSFGFMNNRNNLSTNSALWISIFDCYQSTSFDHTFDNGITIQGPDTSEIDNFTFNALFLKFLCSFKGELNISRISNNGDIRSSFHNFSFSNWKNEVISCNFFRNFEVFSINIFIF